MIAFVCSLGTTGNGKVLVQFKLGAFKLGLPVQPVVLKYEFGSLDTLSWTWDGPSGMLQIWLTLCRWSTGFQAIKLPICYPSEEEKQNEELFANRVCQIISDRLGISASLYSFDDVKFFTNYK